ncbi:hypothetical protein NQD34_005547 [Periophthalmus magnuspinnatus]|nr:hypothetical protein NQD34_005547 [Periophthalmus magnuspinnatus]
MDQSIADLLSDAFTESSVPSFPDDEDLDFENLDFKVDGTNLSQDNNSVDQENSSLMLETTSASIYPNEHKYNSQENDSSSEEEGGENEVEIDEDFIDQIHSNDDEEFYAAGQKPSQNDDQNPNYERSFSFQENIVNKEDITPITETPSTTATTHKETFGAINIEEVKVRVRHEDYPSSEEEREDDEGEIEQKPGDFSETVRCSNDSEQVHAMGQDLGQKDSTQDSNQEGGEEIEEGGYFGIIQGNEGHLLIQDDSSEEDQTESTKTTFFQVEYTLEYPEISYDGIEELNEDIDKMESFSDEEHQEAGESFADYPSDFSSCEYIDNARNAEPSYFETERDCTSDNTAEHQGAEQEYIFLKNGAMKDCMGESSEFSKDGLDELEISNNQDVGLKLTEKQDNDSLQSWKVGISEATKGVCEDNTGLTATWEQEAETTEQNIPMMNQDGICLMGEDVPTTVYSSSGSVDDSFFFNDEPKVYGERRRKEEEMQDDEEEERGREQARIQAFYRFYDDQGEDNVKEERQTKVQFCMETLSRVIHYDTDSSRELSSSSDEEVDKEEDREEDKEGEEDGTDQTYEVETCPTMSSDEEVLSTQELQEAEDLAHMDSPNPQEMLDKITESTKKPLCSRNHRCLFVLKWMLSLFLVVVMGLIMFWWVTDAEEWPKLVL